MKSTGNQKICGDKFNLRTTDQILWDATKIVPKGNLQQEVPT